MKKWSALWNSVEQSGKRRAEKQHPAWQWHGVTGDMEQRSGEDERSTGVDWRENTEQGSKENEQRKGVMAGGTWEQGRRLLWFIICGTRMRREKLMQKRAPEISPTAVESHGSSWLGKRWGTLLTVLTQLNFRKIHPRVVLCFPTRPL